MRFRLDQAIQALQVGGFNQMVLTKTKVNVLVYFHNRLWYDMVCSSAIKTVTFDFAIAPYKITLFSFFFLYLTLQV